MKTYREYISEASLGRIVQHSRNKKIPFGIMTAFRGENPEKTNIQLNKKLASLVRAEGYGFFFVDGTFIENEGTPQEKRVKEDSIFIVGPEGDAGRLKKAMIKWMRDFKQEAVVYRPEEQDGSAFLLFPNGKEEKLGKLRVNKMADVMTKLRKRPGSFVFEGIRLPRNWISALVEKKRTNDNDEVNNEK